MVLLIARRSPAEATGMAGQAPTPRCIPGLLAGVWVAPRFCGRRNGASPATDQVQGAFAGADKGPLLPIAMIARRPLELEILRLDRF
ncbi:hypothetical protein [Salipiger mangrovisoli]|uniref:Uncharacterized protein n=1 Tax=Salipiger mangrovisoli TaxID=2865933 RepID=A0ABR9XB68_9RHOB|nr:hypothetical protein [Salipiger mangrovisoli]MBE9640724.1 hypothetical protein [Salipiger mangrovisoli]